jgi:hypothetical protein
VNAAENAQEKKKAKAVYFERDSEDSEEDSASEKE